MRNGGPLVNLLKTEFHHLRLEMEPPSTLPEKRVRKRSKRLSETDSVSGEVEPARKRLRRGSESSGKKIEEAEPKRRRTGRERGSSSKQPKNGNELVISVNLLQHDLRVSGTSALPMTSSPLEVSPKAGSRNGRSHSRTPVNGNGTNGDSLLSFPRRTLTTKFKNPNFTISYLAANKKKTWKNLKQIVASEKALGWRPDDPIYSSIDAPPSLKPPKKYADLSGLVAKYTDPMTGIYFNTSEEFQLVRTLPSDIVQGYLALRGKLAIT